MLYRLVLINYVIHFSIRDNNEIDTLRVAKSVGKYIKNGTTYL